MKMINYFKKYSIIPVLAAAVLVTGCKKEEEKEEVPEEEHEHEGITHVHLKFTNVADATDTVEVEAVDPDGEGVAELEVLDTINLDQGKTYTLTLEILNEEEHEEEGEEEHEEEHGVDIGAEILEEADEHQLFFAFSDGAFSDPSGDGNIDNASDAINYEDEDVNGNPLGLTTTWTAGAGYPLGEFRVKLMHQPGIKTASTGANDGDADFDLTFVLNVNRILSKK